MYIKSFDTFHKFSLRVLIPAFVGIGIYYMVGDLLDRMDKLETKLVVPSIFLLSLCQDWWGWRKERSSKRKSNF